MQNKPQFNSQYEAIDYYTKQRDSYIQKAREREDILLQKEKEEQEKIKYENADNRLYYFRFSFKNRCKPPHN